MPLVDTTWYIDSVAYAAATAWSTGASKAAGAIIRQNATPTVGNERIFVALNAGTTHATTEPTWGVTRGAKTTDNSSITWQECTGQPGLNGDTTNCTTWATVKNTAVVLGQVIIRASLGSIQICTTAGTAGNGAEPSFSNTAGTTTADNTVTWTSLGAPSNYANGSTTHCRILNAMATNWGAAGNKFFVKSSHAWSQSAGYTIGGNGTLAAPSYIYCHDGNNYPPTVSNLTTGATETTTNNSQSTIVSATALYMEGVKLIISGTNGTITIGGNGNLVYLKNCYAKQDSSGSATPSIVISGGGTVNNYAGKVTLDNFICEFTNASQDLFIGTGIVEWMNTTAPLAGTTIATMLQPTTGLFHQTHMTLRNMDLSGFSGTLVGAADFSGFINFLGCKLHASVTVAGTPTQPGGRINLINCDSGDVEYRNEVYHYAGTQTTEITIVRSGGATDGTTPISWKVVTTANCKPLIPFECPPIAIWVDSTGSKTFTVQGIWGGGAVPNNDQAWVEIDYLGTSGNPLMVTATDGLANLLSTPAAQTAGAGTWGGSSTKFQLDKTVTIQEKGWVYARVKFGKASDTFYIDPKITVT